jgi:NitT/TauT family transport system substrate-binding protein
MVGMTRFSATDLIADRLRDSAKIDRERYFKIQLNDVHVRLKMLLNQEIDAVLLAEPQATEARLAGHRLLADSRQFAPWLGVIAFREKDMQDSTRQRQIEAFKRGYNMACDSLKHYGLNHYRELLVKYFKMKDNHVDSLPSPLPFQHIAEPQEADIEKARNWLKQQ